MDNQPAQKPAVPGGPSDLGPRADFPKRPGSSALFARAKAVIPGGVNSPVRAFLGVGGEPVFVASARGAYVRDVDGRDYVDYVGSWGPMILGHAHPHVLSAVAQAAQNGTSFGAPTEREVTFAETLRSRLPSLEKMRFVSSGTEATMSALRLARGVTGRSKIVKMDGAYHGHADALLVGAGSGVATLGIPGSAGVTEGAARDTLTVPWNDRAAIEALFRRHRGADQTSEIAAVIIEPVCGNMGCVPPEAGYLDFLRSITQAHGTLLIFDEVMTGFRVGRTSAQGLFGIEPDLTCLGKIVGGGLPFGVYGGLQKWMDFVAPMGPVYQAGTLSGNPLAVAAGQALVDLLDDESLYARLAQTTQTLTDELVALCRRAQVPASVNRVGSMFTVFFCSEAVRNYTQAKRADTARYARFFHGLLARGVYFPPSQFEAAFVSAAHGDKEIEQTLHATREALSDLA